MSDFQGCEDILQDFLVEAADMLAGADNKLVELKRAPNDRALLNDIFRGFHTIKGGAGFLNATELVTLCHLTECLFDRLRNGELEITRECMDVILNATAAVREMFTPMRCGTQPGPASPSMIEQLKLAIAGALPVGQSGIGSTSSSGVDPTAGTAGTSRSDTGPNWDELHRALTGAVPQRHVSPAEAPSAGSVAGHTQASEAFAEPHSFGRRAFDGRERHDLRHLAAADPSDPSRAACTSR
jgi:two-component system chemotaxis sensor kinase CheA